MISLGISQPSDGKPPPTSFIHRSLTCGSFIAQADTRLSGPNNDVESQGLSQSIRLTDLSGRHLVSLPIFQRWSRNSKLHGRKVLDGLVWGWKCLTAANGKNYLILFWDCTNPDSGTCQAAMDIRDEWDAIYDVGGHHLPADPRGMTEKDQLEIRKLGLWKDFIQSDLHKNGGFIYFYDEQ